MTYKGWYQTRVIQFRRIRDINFAATISLRTDKTFDERLGWTFATFGHLNFSGSHLEHIYQQILTQYFSSVRSKRIL